MKLILLFFISVLSIQACATGVSTRSILVDRIAYYSTKNPQTLQGPIADDLNAVAALQLTEKDLDLIKNVIKTLLILDDMDPSRSNVERLYGSYQKNKALYDKAFSQVYNSLKNRNLKKQLKEIKQILSEPAQGNG